MNFKKFHESKNLFDGTIALQECGVDWNRYGFTITKAGTYTVSITGVVESGDFCYGRTYSNGEWSQSFYLSTGTTKNTYTASINENEKLVIFNASGSQTKAQSQAKFDRWKIMANFGPQPLPYEPYGSSWADTPHYIHKTSTDTIATLPAVLYPTGTTATVGLKGQAVQSTTPTPQNPVMPQGCGEKTANLFDYKTAYAEYLQPNGDVSVSGVTLNRIPNSLADYVGETVTISIYCKNVFATRIFINSKINNVDIQGSSVYQDDSGYLTLTVTPQTLDDRWFISYGSQGTGNETLSQFMLNIGSTPLPYEPFGVKIPISSANTTTPVYLGEVETTRKIQKLVLTGEEDWKLQSINSYGIANFYIPVSDRDSSSSNTYYCSHFKVKESGISGETEECMRFNTNNQLFLRILSTTASTVSGIQQWLSAQYANGTPVAVWYVLSSATTDTVNEPLMKIGSYADEVSNISIPVTAGGDTLSVDTTVQPSEASVNYKGWHPVADVHERDNGQWD